MKKALLSLVILGGLTLSLSGKFNFTWDNIARAQATAVPSCQFAGYNPQGSLVNTTIVCVSPVASGGAVVTVGATATACGGAVAPSPTGGAVVIQVPVCAPPTAGPALPISIANGGTGTSAPAPTGTNGCTVGTFPSLVVSCPSAAPGPSLPLSVANGGTGTAAPAPTSSNGCTITGTWPAQTFSCPTAAALPSLPLSVANGGTGTAAPAPTSSNGCTVTGTWPSQTFSCPTSAAGAAPSASPPIVYTSGTPGSYSCPTCLVPNASIGAGFPWPLRQSANYCYADPSPTCTFGVTPTSGDFLLGAIVYGCSGSVTTPSGWTAVTGGAACATGNLGVKLYEKTSAGTESTVLFTNGGTSDGIGAIWDFTGGRTVDTVAEAAAGVNILQCPALTSPSNGAGVMCFCAPSSGISAAPIGSWVSADLLNDWAFSSSSGAIYAAAGYAFWQNKVGVGTLYYPYCSQGGTAAVAVVTMSLL